MAKRAKPVENQAWSPESIDPVKLLVQHNFLFRGLDETCLIPDLQPEQLLREKFYSNRPIYTAFRPSISLEYLYALVEGGPVVMRSTPLDRIIAITYPGGCFGMQNLAFEYGKVVRAFPSLVEAHKTTDVVKIPLAVVQKLYETSELFRERYGLLFELQEKFQYHLLNCSTYPPQAVAALFRALIYQERTLGNQPQADGTFVFDLPIDIIARACQLNHRTVEQVLKGMIQVGLLQASKSSEIHGDLVQVTHPEELKSVYGATRDKVAWWPLR
ncbi:MAG: Crp/Fnr family transcriptional regulator [Microcoleaceae cyanobacterium]